MKSQLRDLVEQIRALAESHPAFAQANTVIANCCDHLSAMARVEELNIATHMADEGWERGDVPPMLRVEALRSVIVTTHADNWVKQDDHEGDMFKPVMWRKL